MRLALLVLLLVLVAAGSMQVARRWDAEMDRKGCRDFSADLLPPPAPGGERVSFVAIGDTGNANATQAAVARAVARHCAAAGCDFGLLLGDNFYPDGVSSVNDPLFGRAFEAELARIGLPFYPVLGNHDIHQGGGAYQALYSLKNPLWRMPNLSYRFRRGPAAFYALNSNCSAMALMKLEDWLAEAAPGWRIVFAHHTLYASGKRKGRDRAYRWYWENGFDGRVDFYLSGHNHWLEHLAPPGGPDYIVSGAGSDPTRIKGPVWGEGSAVKSRFRHTGAGFVWLSLSAREARVQFLDTEGRVLHEFTRTR